MGTSAGRFWLKTKYLRGQHETEERTENTATLPNKCLPRGYSHFGIVTLLYEGGGSGRGAVSVSAGAGRSSTDPGAPSVLCGGSCVTPTATCSTTTVEPTGLTARFPSARSSGVLASDVG